jgi:hypothetical protein
MVDRDPSTRFPHFWGAAGTCITIVLTVVAAMTKDLRWLLIFAWPFSGIAIWDAARAWSSARTTRLTTARLTVTGVIISGLCLSELYYWLTPPQKPADRVLALSELTNYDLRQKTKTLTTALRDLGREWSKEEQKLHNEAADKLHEIDQIREPKRYRDQASDNAGREADLNSRYVKEFVDRYQNEALSLRAEIYKREGVLPPYPVQFLASPHLDYPSGMIDVGPAGIADFLDGIADKLPP